MVVRRCGYRSQVVAKASTSAVLPAGLAADGWGSLKLGTASSAAVSSAAAAPNNPVSGRPGDGLGKQLDRLLRSPASGSGRPVSLSSPLQTQPTHSIVQTLMEAHSRITQHRPASPAVKTPAVQSPGVQSPAPGSPSSKARRLDPREKFKTLQHLV